MTEHRAHTWHTSTYCCIHCGATEVDVYRGLDDGECKVATNIYSIRPYIMLKTLWSMSKWKLEGGHYLCEDSVE
jgi:hypothetical protein